MGKVLEVAILLAGAQLFGCSDASQPSQPTQPTQPGALTGGASGLGVGNLPPGGAAAQPIAVGGSGSVIPGTALGGGTTVPNVTEAPSECSDSTHYLPPRIVRLSHTELRQHIEASLPGVDPQLLADVKFQADHLAPASSRGMSGAEFGIYFSAAKNVARAYSADSPELAACRSEGMDPGCLPSLQGVLARLYRRPLLAGESEEFAGAFGRVSAEMGTEQAAAALLAGALVSARTLHHTEAGDSPQNPGVYRLSQRETLSLARYALTGRGPAADELALLGQPAEAFEEGLSQFAASWATTPDFAKRMVDLSEQVFGVEYLSSIQRQEKLFTAEVQSAMGKEFRGFVEAELLSPGGKFENLFLNNPAQVSPELQSVYEDDGLSSTGASPRQGILGLPGLLASLSGATESDPVKRGLLVRELLLCETLPPPVPGADFSQIEVTEDMQTRERFEALGSKKPCDSCHQAINPPGYLFENFDHLGRYRVEEKGRPVNAVSTITPPLGGKPYDGVGDWDGIIPLANWLAKSPEARRCFANNFAGFVLSDAVPHKLGNCNMETAASRFVETGEVADLVADVVRSPLFTHRTREVQP